MNPTAYDFSTSSLNADIGVGLRLDLPIGPLRFDFGYPIIHETFNGPPGKFNFNIELPILNGSGHETGSI